MCSDEERATAGGSGNGKLRQWLIEQVDTGKYPGLVWENDDKSIFRIPWKHAGKQDYNREEDAALFKAWALFKGKYREGIDRPDPPTWKTRLRCALNKSNDFEELVERSQLDISDPYKVYKIVPEGLKKGPKSLEDSLPTSSPPHYLTHPPPAPAPPPPQMCNYISPAERGWRDYTAGLSEITYSQSPFTPRWDPGYQFSGSFYSCNPSDPQLSPFTLDTSMRTAEAVALSDYRLHITVYYRDIPVREVTISSPEGCQLGPADASPGVPELVELPEAEGSSVERGLMLWMAPDGLYARRRCPRRVYWMSSDKHNKLEREHTCKLLDTQLFITELQSYALHARPVPSSAVLLLFDDEDSDGQRPRQTTTVKVEPMFARQLLILAHSGGANYIRTHDFTRLPPEHHLFTQSHAPSAQQHC